LSPILKNSNKKLNETNKELKEMMIWKSIMKKINKIKVKDLLMNQKKKNKLLLYLELLEEKQVVDFNLVDLQKQQEYLHRMLTTILDPNLNLNKAHGQTILKNINKSQCLEQQLYKVGKD
jgi:hypothetical protein